MDLMFRDKILTCASCGNHFVYTVGQQRMALDEHGEISDPAHCPLCEVKRERGVRLTREQPSLPVGTLQFGAPHENGREEGGPPSWPFPSRSEAPAPPSPNRPPDYRSGEEHPLHGHGGESEAGVVKWFNDRKGFGFITLDNGVDLFVHYSAIMSEGYRTLKQGQRVSLVIEDTGKGPQASAVQLLREQDEDGVQSESDIAVDSDNDL